MLLCGIYMNIDALKPMKIHSFEFLPSKPKEKEIKNKLHFSLELP